MTGSDSAFEKVPRRHRPTVRIIETRTATRTAVIGLLLTVCVTAMAFAVFQFWQFEDAIPPMIPRTLGEIILDWKCDAGHLFHQSGQMEATVCPQCGALAFPVDTYVCEVHGAVPISVLLGAGPDGEPQVRQTQVPGRDWTDIENGVHCPRCGRAMTRKPRDPLEGVFKRKKKEVR